MYDKKQNQCLGIGRKRKRKCNSESERIESFWTVCPYCYYVYEYEIVYQDYCLRCQNCKMAFHGVSINGPLPKSVMVEGKEQYYCCLGFFKFHYFDRAGVVVNDEENKIDCNENRRRRGFVNNNEILGCEFVEKFGIIDDEFSIRGIENKCRLMNDDLEEGIVEELKHEGEIELGGLEFYDGGDDIYIGLSDLW